MQFICIWLVVIFFYRILGQERVNQLGGVFVNGKPLPKALRIRIIQLISMLPTRTNNYIFNQKQFTASI